MSGMEEVIRGVGSPLDYLYFLIGGGGICNLKVKSVMSNDVMSYDSSVMTNEL